MVPDRPFGLAARMIDFDYTTPENYAKRIARHISDPSTIWARTADQFGRHRAPSLEQCREWRAKHERKCVPAKPRPFPCGHPRDPMNIIEYSDSKEKCLACYNAKATEREAVLRAARERKHKLAEEARIAALRAAMAAQRACIEPIENHASGMEVLAGAAKAFQITLGELLGEARSPLYVSARAVAARLLQDGGASFPMIGRRMNRDHSSIVNLLAKWDQRVAKYPYMLTVYEALRKHDPA
jgi:hypothetical protein